MMNLYKKVWILLVIGIYFCLSSSVYSEDEKFKKIHISYDLGYFNIDNYTEYYSQKSNWTGTKGGNLTFSNGITLGWNVRYSINKKIDVVYGSFASEGYNLQTWYREGELGDAIENRSPYGTIDYSLTGRHKGFGIRYYLSDKIFTQINYSWVKISRSFDAEQYMHLGGAKWKNRSWNEGKERNSKSLVFALGYVFRRDKLISIPIIFRYQFGIGSVDTGSMSGFSLNVGLGLNFLTRKISISF